MKKDNNFVTSIEINLGRTININSCLQKIDNNKPNSYGMSYDFINQNCYSVIYTNGFFVKSENRHSYLFFSNIYFYFLFFCLLLPKIVEFLVNFFDFFVFTFFEIFL